jgi:hypothetical protein
LILNRFLLVETVLELPPDYRRTVLGHIGLRGLGKAQGEIESCKANSGVTFSAPISTNVDELAASK